MKSLYPRQTQIRIKGDKAIFSQVEEIHRKILIELVSASNLILD